MLCPNFGLAKDISKYVRLSLAVQPTGGAIAIVRADATWRHGIGAWTCQPSNLTCK